MPFFKWLYSGVYNAITSAFADAIRDVNAGSPEVKLVPFSAEQKSLPAPEEEAPAKRRGK